MRLHHGQSFPGCLQCLDQGLPVGDPSERSEIDSSLPEGMNASMMLLGEQGQAHAIMIFSQ